MKVNNPPVPAPSLTNRSPEDRCGTPLPQDVAGAEAAIRQAMQRTAEASSFTVIPVVVHVVKKNATTGAVPQAQIEAQIQTLRDAYKDHGFGFELKQVTETQNPAWYAAGPGTSAEVAMKKKLHQGDATTLNLYTSAPQGGVLGWAQFPSDQATNPTGDGVVILNTALTGGQAPFDEGDTAVHEVGHWLGLWHTFNQSKGPGLPLGDEISDTPEHNVNYGKPPQGTDTLPNKPGLDPIDNYMNYVDDAAMDKLTVEQRERIAASWKAFREPAE